MTWEHMDCNIFFSFKKGQAWKLGSSSEYNSNLLCDFGHVVYSYWPIYSFVICMI